MVLRLFACLVLFLPLHHSAFAETSAKNGSRLVRMLTGRSDAVREGALTRLRNSERLLASSHDELILATRTLVTEAEEGSVSPCLVQMIDLIGQVDRPESEAVLTEWLGHANTSISMLCSESLGRHKFHGAIDAIYGQRERPDYDSYYGFRFNLVKSLALMEHPAAIEYIAALEGTLDGQLSYEISRLLAKVTREDFAGDDQRFQAFLKRSEQPEGFFRAAKFSLDRAKEYRKAEPKKLNLAPPRQYYGIDIRAQRVMFIIDQSGSMREPTSSGTRLARAQQELIRAIRELPADTEFAIAAFNTRIRVWRKGLAPATDEQKMAAIQYVQRLEHTGDTNTYGALRTALTFDDSLEAVFLLTDGRPTAGPITRHDEIARDILHRNRWRHLNINTIGISVGGRTESFLRGLAENSGGEFRAAQ